MASDVLNLTGVSLMEESYEKLNREVEEDKMKELSSASDRIPWLKHVEKVLL